MPPAQRPPPGSPLAYRIAVLSTATALAALAIAYSPRLIASSRQAQAHAPLMASTRSRSSSSSSDSDRPPRDLISALKRAGYTPSDQGGGGDCLFRSLSHQLYRTPAKHLEVRQRVADEIASNRKTYEDDVAIMMMEGFPRVKGDPFDAYVSMLKRQGFLGDAVSIAAFSRKFGFPVRVFLHDASKDNGLAEILFENYEGKPAGGEKKIGWIQSGFSEAANHYISVLGPDEQDWSSEFKAKL